MCNLSYSSIGVSGGSKAYLDPHPPTPVTYV